MELRHLRYFIAVAEELNFRRAAQRLYIAPPPLSVQIRKLEEEIGTALLVRHARGVKLTEAGRVFLEQARQTLAGAKRGMALAREAGNGELGSLCIGYNAPAGFLVFPRVIPSFKSARPKVQLTFRALNMPQQLEGLAREDLDLGLVWLPAPLSGLDAQAVVSEPLIVVVPATHRLAAQSEVSLQDLSQEPMILPSRTLHPDTHREILDAFHRARSVLNIAYELESSLSMINFVAMGAGCSLLPDYVRNICQPGVTFRPLRAPGIVKSLAIIKKKGRKGLADFFYRHVADTLRSAVSPERRRGTSARH
jgi:DNA-binding transcriptional LysR family regulator